jgi:hypothetical protein
VTTIAARSHAPAPGSEGGIDRRDAFDARRRRALAEEMRVHIEQTFTIAAPPADVFGFMVDPENLAKWQTVKTYVTPVSEGSPRLGHRVREGTKVRPLVMERRMLSEIKRLSEGLAGQAGDRSTQDPTHDAGV